MTDFIKAEYECGLKGTQHMEVQDTQALLGTYFDKAVYRYDRWEADHDIPEKLKLFRYNAGAIDLIIGKLTGIPDFDASRKLNELLNYDFSEDGVFKSYENKHERLLFELQSKWKTDYPLQSMHTTKGIITPNTIEISEITENLKEWLEFQKEMDLADDFLAFRMMEYLRHKADEADKLKSDQKLALKPRLVNDFMRSIWDMLTMEMTVRKKSKQTMTGKLDQLAADMPDLSVFLEMELLRWCGTEMPKLLGKARSIILVNPINLQPTFEGRAARNNNVINMINWLSNCRLTGKNAQQLQCELVGVLLGFQEATENACIRDAIAFATIGISQTLSSLWDAGKLVAGWVGGSLGVKPEIESLVQTIDNVQGHPTKPDDYEVCSEMIKMAMVGLCFIFGQNLQTTWDKTNIKSLLYQCQSASRK